MIGELFRPLTVLGSLPPLLAVVGDNGVGQRAAPFAVAPFQVDALLAVALFRDDALLAVAPFQDDALLAVAPFRDDALLTTLGDHQLDR